MIGKINTLICMKKKSLMEDERNNKAQRPHIDTRQNSKRHISLVSLLLWHKMVAVCCFVRALGLQLWSVSESVSQSVRRNFKFKQF